jgi:putative ABC transport system permease protein
VLGRQFRISGLSRGSTSITNTMVFIPRADFAALRGPAVSYVLVHAKPGVDTKTLVQRVHTALPATTVQTRDEFVEQEASITRDMSADILQIMTLIALLIALAVIALTLFSATLGKLREYAVIKALGASTLRLARTVLAQAAWSSLLALALAFAVSLLIAAGVAAATPNIRLAIELSDVVRVGVAALLLGGIGALLPLRRLARVDPATAFKD